MASSSLEVQSHTHFFWRVFGLKGKPHTPTNSKGGGMELWCREGGSEGGREMERGRGGREGGREGEGEGWRGRDGKGEGGMRGEGREG